MTTVLTVIDTLDKISRTENVAVPYLVPNALWFVVFIHLTY